MTTLAMDVRELSIEEIDCVSGGVRRWLANAILSGAAYDLLKQALLGDGSPESRDENPFLADRASSR